MAAAASYRDGVAMREPDEGDVVEQGGTPLRRPEWARRPRWLPAPAGRYRVARPSSAWPA